MSHKCHACQKSVVHNVNGEVYRPLGIVTAYCNECLYKYDTVRFTCSGCKTLFDPNMEGIVGDVKSFCGECCNTLDADENLTDDMADRIANGATFMEA